MAHRLYRLVAERARRRCEYCLAIEAIFNHPFEVEHIAPRVAGGADEESNLALACRACNSSKFRATAAPDPVSSTVVRLFNPRTDSWGDHFVLDLANGVINGQTAIGRATVVRLRMNGPQRLKARYRWILYFGFPDGASGLIE